MSDLSQDELTVLLIAAKGEAMMPIGRWRAPAERLVEKGFLKPQPHLGDPTGFFNLHITPAGRSEVQRDEQDTMLTMASLSAAIEHDTRKIRADAEQIATQMVDLALASSKVTGEPPLEAMAKWGKLIGQRALELLK